MVSKSVCGNKVRVSNHRDSSYVFHFWHVEEPDRRCSGEDGFPIRGATRAPNQLRPIPNNFDIPSSFPTADGTFEQQLVPLGLEPESKHS